MKFIGPDIKQRANFSNIRDQIELVLYTRLKRTRGPNSLCFKRSAGFSCCFRLEQTCSKKNKHRGKQRACINYYLIFC